MDTLFLKIMNMSFAASWLILAILLLRIVLKKAPRWISVLLWGIVAVRLICPITLESALSLIPTSETIPLGIGTAQEPAIHSGLPALNTVVNPILSQSGAPLPGASVNSVQVWIAVGSYVWLSGMAVMLLYAAISFFRLHRKVGASLHLKDRIWICDEIQTPFILGMFRPRIYIPSGIDENSFPPIIAHENAHLQRRDHWWKPLGFFVLAVHWFNPLVWIAYILLCRDIELACDEKVIQSLGKEGSIAYSEALLSCSVGRRTILVCPLAFGEVGVKERVKHVLNYKKPAFWIVLAAVIASVVLSACFLTNPKGPREFPMTGRNLSDLNTDQILSGICEAEGLDDGSKLNFNADNFDLMVTDGFDLDNAGAISFSYVQNQKTYSAQLRLFYEENQYFVTERSEWPEQTQIYKLRHYLDALRYLPQEEIRKLSPDADHYSIYLRPEGTPKDYSRVVTYGKDGAGEIDGWQIHLEIAPLKNGHGIGTDVIHAFYTSSGFDALADSSPFGRTYHVHEIVYSDPVYDFAYTLETAPLYEFTGDQGLLICENKNDMIWLNAGTFREITLEKENFAARFRDLDDMGWNGMDADTLAEENQQAWQLAVADQAENTVIYNLLLQKNGDLYLTYGYGSASGSGDIELNSIRWVFYLAEGLSSVSVSNDPAEVIDASLDAAIQTTLADHYAPNKPDGLINVESYKLLFQQELCGVPKAGQEQFAKSVNVYLLVLHESFRPDSDPTQPIEEVGGSYIPTALTFRLSDGQYLLEEYWEPRDGGHYTDDIKSKFPEEAERQVWDDQEIIRELQLANQEQIHRILLEKGSFENLATDLLNTICQSSNHASDPGAYIWKAHEQYDELLGYGEATLRYCFRQFLEGGQTDLKGHIMAELCRDLMAKQFGMAREDELYETGQAWFDAFYANSLKIAENVSPEDFEKYHPVSKLLLDVTGEDPQSKQFRLSGVDQMESAEVILYDDGRFEFFFSPYSSYIGRGTYEAEQDRLKLCTDDGLFTYLFDLVEGNLVYDEFASQGFHWYSGLKNGAVMEPVTEENNGAIQYDERLPFEQAFTFYIGRQSVDWGHYSIAPAGTDEWVPLRFTGQCEDLKLIHDPWYYNQYQIPYEGSECTRWRVKSEVLPDDPLIAELFPDAEYSCTIWEDIEIINGETVLMIRVSEDDGTKYFDSVSMPEKFCEDCPSAFGLETNKTN